MMDDPWTQIGVVGCFIILFIYSYYEVTGGFQ